MLNTKPHIMIYLLLSIASTVGCVESQQTNRSEPFEVQKLDACLAIVIDMSGSFADSWDDRAFLLFQALMDKFFTEGQGGDSKIILAQLSGSTDVVLFEGTPAELRRRFRSSEELNAFLKENSSPDGSKVYQATRQTIDYLSQLPGITEKTLMLTVILSDLADTESDAQARHTEGHAMLKSLTNYQEHGGGLALYYVSQPEIVRWQRILSMAGFKPGQYVIQNTLVENPQLPSFE